MKPHTLLMAALVAGLSAAAGAAELKLAHFMPPTHPMDQHVMRPMAEAFNQAVDGTSTIKIYPAGELGKGPKQQYKRVATGVAELAFVLPAFTEKLFPVLTGYELPGLHADGPGATAAMWADRDSIAAEVKQAVPLAAWANNPTILITKGRAVRSPEDLRGMKIRIANSKTAAVISAWGGSPVNMPPTEAYQALSTGSVDGIYIDPSAFKSYKLYEVTDYATVNIPGSVSAFLLAMNKDAHAALSDAEREALAAVSGEALGARAARAFKAAGDAGLQLAADNGVEVITLSDAERAAFQAMSPFAAN